MPPKNQAKACSVTGGATLQERGNAAYLREAYTNTHNKEDHAFQSNRQNKSYNSLHACLNAVVHDKNSQNYSPSSKLCDKLLNAKNREAIDSIMQSETPRYYKLADYDAAKKAVAIATPSASPSISPVSFEPDSGGGGGGGGGGRGMASPVQGSTVWKPIAKPKPFAATFGVPSEAPLAAGSTTITKAKKRNVRSPRLQRSPRRSVHRKVRRSKSPKASPKRPRGPIRLRRRDRNDNLK